MNIIEYIKLKYSTNNPAIILKREAIVFGIPYPLKSGWIEEYGTKIVTNEMKLRLRSFFQSSDLSNVYSVMALEMLGGNLSDQEVKELKQYQKNDLSLSKTRKLALKNKRLKL